MKKPRAKKYKFKGKVWKYRGPAAWHFITLPKKLSRMVRKNHGQSEEGWGRLKATAEVGRTKWATAIWFDTKAAGYVLPIKASIRKVEDIYDGSSVAITLYVQVEDSRFRLFDRRC